MCKISVIIVSFNTKDQVSDCLETVFEQLEGLDGEVFVVDNNSNDSTPAMIREKFPAVHLIANDTNLGFGKANNLAIRVAKSEFVVLLNSDTALQKGFFELVIEFMKSHPDVGILGCLLRNTDWSIQSSAYVNYPGLLTEVVGYSFLGKFLNRFFPFTKYPGKYELSPEEYKLPREVAHVTGACMVIRKQVFEDVGVFDEDFFMYREETDLCKRASEKGWKIYYYPKVEVLHHHKVSSSKLQDKGINYRLTSHYLYFRKHYGSIYTVMSYGLICGFTFLHISWLVLAKLIRKRIGSDHIHYYRLILNWHFSKINLAKIFR